MAPTRRHRTACVALDRPGGAAHSLGSALAKKACAWRRLPPAVVARAGAESVQTAAG